MHYLYKNNFRIDEKKQLDLLIRQCIRVSSIHIKYLHFSGKLFFSYDITYNDLAVDLIAEIFETKDNVLVCFKKFFEKLGEIKNDVELDKRIRFFIISVVNRNLVKFYKDNDPVGFKLIRNIDYAIETKRYFVTHLLTDKYIHRKEADFNLPIIEREKLTSLFYASNKTLLTGTAFLSNLFDVLESFTNYSSSLPYFDIVSIYKEMLVTNFFNNNSNTINSFEFDRLNTVLLVNEAFESFKHKFDKYSRKVKFSENTRNRFINILIDVKDSYCNLSKKDSINNYILKNFEKYEMDSLQDKLEYCVGLFNNEILSLIKSEDIYEGK